MEAIKKNLDDDPIQPSQIRLEDAAIAVLIDRIASLGQESKDDLMEVFMAIAHCEDAEDLDEIRNTMREILYPQLAGDLILGSAGDATPTEELKKWSESIGARIKTLREEKGISQMDLAEKCGLAQSHISRLENGAHSPSRKTVQTLAEALGVEVKKIDPGVMD